jgi:hypothetical protein
VALVMMAAPLGAAISQSPRTVTLRVDNDAFDFWMEPWNRPDDEYSSGVHITYDGGGAPAWYRAGGADRQPCIVHAPHCSTERVEIGQDIYTPATSHDSPLPAPNARPSAGWLYVSQTARRLDESTSDELSLTFGVTGPPSLASVTQRLAHAAAPKFNRPTDWSRQIQFEPGVIARFERRMYVLDGSLGPLGADLVPLGAAALGNVRTSAELGFTTDVGWKLRHPWLPSGLAPEIALFGGTTGEAVARDLFLDGNTFRRGPRVGHEPFVVSGNVGARVRYQWLMLEYRVESDSRAYAAGPTWHPWASMIGGVTFGK